MRINSVVAALVLLWTASCSSASVSATGWPDWDDFSDRFVQKDGRVVDLTFDGKSTSEGQSYGLFFALVANQRTRFDAILAWTSSNLADNRLGDRLPAWLWGKNDDDSWGVKDRNSASDGDLWLAYTLLEAARLWHAPAYAVVGRKLLAQVAEHETVKTAAGSLLLPGPMGFVLDHGRYRIDPSYVPGFQFHYFAAIDAQGPWQGIWNNYLRMAPKIYRAGVAPDLFIVDSAGIVTQDSERDASGSYDAIRIYLWAAMSGHDSDTILALLKPYAKVIRTVGAPPERVNPATGAVTKADFSPIGFSGAVLPFLKVLGERDTLQQQLERVSEATSRAHHGESTNYYDQALILFGKGWLDGQYRFDAEGRLIPRWIQ